MHRARNAATPSSALSEQQRIRIVVVEFDAGQKYRHVSAHRHITRPRSQLARRLCRRCGVHYSGRWGRTGPCSRRSPPPGTGVVVVVQHPTRRSAPAAATPNRSRCSDTPLHVDAVQHARADVHVGLHDVATTRRRWRRSACRSSDGARSGCRRNGSPVSRQL